MPASARNRGFEVDTESEQLAMGDFVRLLLRGKAGSHSAEALVEMADFDSLRLRLNSGKSVSVPASAIITIEKRVPSDPGIWKNASLPTVMGSIVSPLHTLMVGGSPAIGTTLAAEIERVQVALADASACITKPAHRKVMSDFEVLLNFLLRRLRASTYGEAEEFRQNYLHGVIALRKQCAQDITAPELGVAVSGLCDRVAIAENTDWAQYTQRFDPRPRIVTTGVVTINVDASGEFLLPIRITLDDTYLPATQVTVTLDNLRGLDLVGHSPVEDRLAPGDTVTLNVRMADRRRQGTRGDLKINARLTYAGVENVTRQTARQNVHIRLRATSPYQPISNPFRDYAGGIPIDDPGMFFGRDTLVNEIVELLTDPRLGRCYALYGQKRTGKSSVLEQVRLRLESDGVLVASVSMGTIDRQAITAGFVEQVVDQYRVQVGGRLGPKVFERLLTRWPDIASVEREPLRSLRRAVSGARALLKSQGITEPRFAIVVDEFTYLYEILLRPNVSTAESEQLRDFMRQWKGLLEAKLFSALVVGQDTMPHFLRAFPNEFSIMQTERLDYLTPDETEMLANEPIRNPDGSSRFAGYALSNIPGYTDGHPFFTQIVCDRIVTVANEERRTEIAESDVEAAIETLLSGPREIDFHRFDCLLSADNTDTLLTEFGLHQNDEPAHEIALRVLYRLACLSGGQNSPVAVDRLHLTPIEELAYRDLVVRAVVVDRNGYAQIRVLLFAEYLRRMTA